MSRQTPIVAEDDSFVFTEQVITPVERGSQRLVTRRRRSRTSNRRTMIEQATSSRGNSWCATGGKLDRQRNSSSRRRICATIGASASARTNPLERAAARSTNRRTAGYSSAWSAVMIPRGGSGTQAARVATHVRRRREEARLVAFRIRTEDVAQRSSTSGAAASMTMLAAVEDKQDSSSGQLGEQPRCGIVWNSNHSPLAATTSARRLGSASGEDR